MRFCWAISNVFWP